MPQEVPQVIRIRFESMVDGRLKKDYTTTTDRLQVLIKRSIDGQQDHFSHDPSTMTLLRARSWKPTGTCATTWRSIRCFSRPRSRSWRRCSSGRDLKGLILEREVFLQNLVYARNNGSNPSWESQVTHDRRARLRVCRSNSPWSTGSSSKTCGSWPSGVNAAAATCSTSAFYEFDPSPEAKQAFNAYVACKWPLHVYSVDPAVEQQNVLDAFSRRSELQLALAVAVA